MRRSIYRSGSLRLEERKHGPSLWVFRYYDHSEARVRRRKLILGTTEELPTRAEAERAAEPYRLTLNREVRDVPPPTMEALIERYLTTKLPPQGAPDGKDTEVPERTEISEHCARCYRSAIKLHIRPRWTSRPDGRPYMVRDFEHVTMSTAIEEWLAGLIRSKQNPKGLAPKTVRHVFTLMKLIFKYAVKWGYLNRNPMAEKLVELPRGSTRRSTKPRCLTPPEFTSLVKALPCAREKLLVVLVGLLGPRISEAVGLKWRDIDFIDHVIHFERGSVQGRVTALKTEASRSELPLPVDVANLLLAWRMETPFRLPDDWVFASAKTNGKRPYWPHQLLKAHIVPTAVTIGIGRIGWHTFRHSYTAWGKASGLGGPELKELLRHETVKMTMTYGPTDVEAKRGSNRQILDYVRREATAVRPKTDTIQ
jgi:integrase